MKERTHNNLMKALIKQEVTYLFEKVLDFAEVAVADKNQYKALRARILRLGNNCIRELLKALDEDYKIVSTDQGKLVIERRERPGL